MKFLVLNGSPKGKNSITLETIHYLAKRFPGYEFDIIDISSKIKSIEKDPSSIIGMVGLYDQILFVYPVYTFLAPSQLAGFIRILKERNVSLEGKYVSQITTSKHFYDMTAHKYIEENVLDLNGKYIRGLSLDMEDLTKIEGRDHIDSYFRFLVHSIKEDIYEIPGRKTGTAHMEYERHTNGDEPKKEEKDIVIVTDTLQDESLIRLIYDFRNLTRYKTRIVNIGDFNFQGGCLGCLKCALHSKCVYTDGFHELLMDIQRSDAIIYAFRIEDHSMGPVFKTYDDRQFENGHRTLTEGKPTGYLIIGDIDKENNLKTVMEARADTGKNYLSGIANDFESLKMMTQKLDYSIENHLEFPRGFYGIGGLKIFRDLIWGMRGIMKDDYEFYKNHKMFDFPQKKWGTMFLMILVGKLMRNKKLMKKMGSKMDEGMLSPYKKVIDNTEPIEL